MLATVLLYGLEAAIYTFCECHRLRELHQIGAGVGVAVGDWIFALGDELAALARLLAGFGKRHVTQASKPHVPHARLAIGLLVTQLIAEDQERRIVLSWPLDACRYRQPPSDSNTDDGSPFGFAFFTFRSSTYEFLDP
jgi:hypothetical protein